MVQVQVKGNSISVSLNAGVVIHIETVFLSIRGATSFPLNIYLVEKIIEFDMNGDNRCAKPVLPLDIFPLQLLSMKIPTY